MTDWISVDDRLPEKFKEVLAINEDYGRYSIAYHSGYVWYVLKWEDDSTMVVTHWTPLPPPPNGDTDENQRSDQTTTGGEGRGGDKT